MTARDDYPFNMHDPWMTWRHMCDEIDRLRAEVSRYRTLTQEYNETCSKLTDRVAELHAELALMATRPNPDRQELCRGFCDTDGTPHRHEDWTP